MKFIFILYLIVLLDLNFYIVLVLSSAFSSSSSFIPPIEDEINYLPGYNNKLSSKHYSGFLNITEYIANDDSFSDITEMLIHYYFIEAEEKDLTNDKSPLILWSNGGPGASSMFGLFTEIGPYHLSEASLLKTDYDNVEIAPKLFLNLHNWNKKNHLLVFDWPPPTGFSYCNNKPNDNGYSCGNWNDEKFGIVSYYSLLSFLSDKFSIYRKNKLYLIGESYAGVYIPKLVENILKYDPLLHKFNLKGIALGDACAGTEVMCGNDNNFGQYYNYLFLYGHGQFSNLLWENLMEFCGINNLKYNNIKPNNDKKCNYYKNQVNNEIGYIYDYNLYDTCTYQNSFRRRSRRKLNNNQKKNNNILNKESYYPCGGGNALTIWTSNINVRKTLNVPLNSNFFSGDNANGMNYTLTEKNLIPFFNNILNNYKDKIELMIYNGDTDPSINSFASQNWTSYLDGQNQIYDNNNNENYWKPWTIDSCQNIGGYIITNNKNNFKFVTIRGSGHMVPTYKPQFAYEMINNFIYNLDFKSYDSNPDCINEINY